MEKGSGVSRRSHLLYNRFGIRTDETTGAASFSTATGRLVSRPSSKWQDPPKERYYQGEGNSSELPFHTDFASLEMRVLAWYAEHDPDILKKAFPDDQVQA